MDIKEFFRLHGKIAVAFSGGVDSAVLLLLARKYAKEVKAYYVKSQFQPLFEYDDAVKIAELLNVELRVIKVSVTDDEKICSNPADRCYYCKRRIFETICRETVKDGFDTVADGTNASDDISDRPGFAALQELKVISPLKECGLTKKDIRRIAAENGLPVADKPSYACLATRIPTGTVITDELLRKTEQAENILFAEGFKNFRVRYMNGTAKLELSADDFEKLIKSRERIVNLLSGYYDGVFLDLREREDE